MLAVPTPTPVTIPPEVTVIIDVDELLHVPPVDASVSVSVLPVHIAGEDGESADGPGFTVTTFVTVQIPAL